MSSDLRMNPFLSERPLIYGSGTLEVVAAFWYPLTRLQISQQQAAFQESTTFILVSMDTSV
jgi:hypothetical protein